MWLCKEKYPNLFLPLLITATTGCLVSKLIAIKFASVNINRCEITIKNQLERKFVVEEIIVAKERYDYWKSVTPGFCDEGYIWYQPNGRPHARSDYSKPFNALKQKLGLPEDFHWHDLRHAYATIQINSHGVPEFDSFIDEILPSDEPQVIDWAFSQLFLDYVLPNSVA